MNILLGYPDEKIRESLSFFLESRYQANVQKTGSAKTTLKQLVNEEAEYHLVLLEFSEIAKEIMETHDFLLEKVPSIFCVKTTQKSDLFRQASKPKMRYVESSDLLENVAREIDGFIEKGFCTGPKGDAEFTRINTNLLLMTSPLKSDIYIRLSDKKFVKLMREGDEFDRRDLDKYTVQKKIEYLFLKARDTQEFVSKLKSQLLDEIKIMAQERAGQQQQVESPPHPSRKSADQPRAETLTREKQPGVSAPKEEQKTFVTPESTKQKRLLPQILEKNPEAVHEVIFEMTTKLGFTKEVQELAKVGMKVAVETIQRSSRLEKILANFSKEKAKYIPAHSMLAGYLACMIGAKMDWKSESTYEKLMLAAMLHDITIKNNDLAAIETLDEMKGKESSFSAAEVEAFKKHPILCSELAKSMSEVPPDVDLIILQHHERADGSGFPKKLNQSRISPISSVFIVAHEITQFLYDLDESQSLSQKQLDRFYTLYKDVYDKGNFKKVLAIIPTLG